MYELKPPSTPYTVLPPALVGGTKDTLTPAEILRATSTGTDATGTNWGKKKKKKKKKKKGGKELSGPIFC